MEIFGVECDVFAVEGLDLEVGRIGAGLERTVGDQFGSQLAAGPFEFATAFQTRGVRINTPLWV